MSSSDDLFLNALAPHLESSSLPLPLPLAPGLLEKLPLLGAELLRWNRTHNLSGHHDPRGVALDLFLDGLVLASFPESGRLLDIGSGAGFPGLVLALARPGLEVTLLEPRAKRVSFLKHAVRVTGLLERVRVIRDKAGQGALAGERFHWVTMRAVADLKGSLALARPYLALGGQVLLPRGPGDRDEALALGLEVTDYQLPRPFGPRIIARLKT